FAAFARFCALAQANDLIAQSLKRDEPNRSEDEANGGGRNEVDLEEGQNEW
ncbi:SIR2 family protein, partial [Escherichia coli]|nr:SIR2 family protein [Escherichia coli]